MADDEIADTIPTNGVSNYNDEIADTNPTNGVSNHNNHQSKKQKIQSFITSSEIRSEFAHHDPGMARINNGSFGSCPNSIIEAQRRYQLEFFKQPDRFFYTELQPRIFRSRKMIKELINADDVSEVSIVDNVTTAVAIVLRHVSWEFCEGNFDKGDVVVILDCAFEAVKKSIHAYVRRAGGEVVVVETKFPVVSEEEIVERFRKGIRMGKEGGRRIRLAIIDHVTSMPCVVVPIKEMVRVCREEGVEYVFVDAAHAIGSVKVDVRDIGADFYVSNLHKWLFCPPSVAFFYCRKSRVSGGLHHPVVSSQYGNGLAIESSWIGTRDYSSQLVVPEVLEFVNRFEGGIEGIRQRNHDAVVEMGEMLAKAWGTSLGCPPDMCPSMAMVGLPSSLGIISNDHTQKLRTHLRNEFGVEVPLYYHGLKDGEVGVRDGNGLITTYARISHQVYNTVSDYLKFRDAVNQLVQKKFTCQMLS